MKKIVYILVLCLLIIFPIYGQECPILIIPSDEATNVPVNTDIVWVPSEGVPGYQIRLGTSSGGADIAQVSVGSATSYTPPLGLPENTEIFVTIVLDFLFQGGDDVVCVSESFTTESITTVPNATTITNPADNAVNVNVNTNISWEYAPSANDYGIIVGTTPGGNDIVNNPNVGNRLSFKPDDPLPANTTLYVQVIPKNGVGPATGIPIHEFTTGDIAALPACTELISPSDGTTNVPLSPILEWRDVGAEEYRVTITTTLDPSGPDDYILDDAVFFENSTAVFNFENNKTYFITITPSNGPGQSAIGCTQTTFSTEPGCTYLDPYINQIVDLNPQTTFPTSQSFCENLNVLVLDAPVGADNYRWFSVDQFGGEELIQEGDQVTITEEGSYRLEAYNISGSTECIREHPFIVQPSEIATITGFNAFETPRGLDVIVQTTGNGDYEFSVDNRIGPYKDSNVFKDLTLGNHTFFVRDKSGCGIVEKELVHNLDVEGFPKFFTPNGDNINDFWQYIPPRSGQTQVFESIRIFDRYGKFIKEIGQNTIGWDGNFLGNPMPSGNYWFKAVETNAKVTTGNFMLKR